MITHLAATRAQYKELTPMLYRPSVNGDVHIYRSDRLPPGSGSTPDLHYHVVLSDHQTGNASQIHFEPTYAKAIQTAFDLGNELSTTKE